MHVCAWCDRKLEMRPGRVRGVPATNWGICPTCLSNRLVALMAAPPFKPLLPSDLDLARLEAEKR